MLGAYEESAVFFSEIGMARRGTVGCRRFLSGVPNRIRAKQ